MVKRKDVVILSLSIPLAILTAIVSCAGIFIQNTYSKETISYAIQGIGQDIVNLFIIVPLLIISAVLAYRNNKTGLFLWSGSLFYLAYSYTLYAFALHFNNLFILYCLILGLSVYSFLYFLLISVKNNIKEWFIEKYLRKTTSIFLFIIAGAFYCLWLSEIIPAIIKQQVPSSVIENGLLTNPVHVLDLAICLPALILTGIFLLKNKQIGLLLAPAMLIFCILMAIAIAAMVFVMKMKGLEVGILLTTIFGTITLISII
ncbi:MAG: hypothetical protein ACUVXI_02400, partial [bacterium]